MDKSLTFSISTDSAGTQTVSFTAEEAQPHLYLRAISHILPVSDDGNRMTDDAVSYLGFDSVEFWALITTR